MDINEFTKQQGEFLKAEIVKENPEVLFEIVGEATVEHNMKYDTDRLYIPVKFKDSVYTFDCSKTNARQISAFLAWQGEDGSDTSKWIGKFLVLEIYRTKTSDGKMTDAINVKEVK